MYVDFHEYQTIYLFHVPRTAVHAAAFSDHVECMQLLVSRGAATGLADNMGRTPLMMAAHFGHTNVVGMYTIELSIHVWGSIIVLISRYFGKLSCYRGVLISGVVLSLSLSL